MSRYINFGNNLYREEDIMHIKEISHGVVKIYYNFFDKCDHDIYSFEHDRDAYEDIVKYMKTQRPYEDKKN